MILLLDTTVLIDVLRARAQRRQLLAELVEAGHTLATTAINVGELYAGMRAGEEARTEALLGNLACYAITERIARKAGTLKRDFRQQGITLSLTDMIVAATAMEENLTLMTDNRRDFPMPELKLYPLQP